MSYCRPTVTRWVNALWVDRRFMAEAFAQTAAASLHAGFDVLLAETYAPTPAFSWAKQHNALGALVITASHNPGS